MAQTTANTTMKTAIRSKSRETTDYGAIPIHHAEEGSLQWRQTNVGVLAAAFSAALATGGPTYAFGIYGGELKSRLHFTQSQLDTLSSANFTAGLLSWIPGLCVDRIGTRWSMAMGGTIMFVALMAYWAVAKQLIEFPSEHILPLLCTLGVVIFMSNSLVIGSLFKAIVIGCGPGSKGAAVGAAKAYVGLGAGVYACLFNAIKANGESDLDFLPMGAILAIVNIALPAVCWLPASQRSVVDVSTPSHYRTIYTSLLVLAILVVGTSALFMFRPLPDDDDFGNDKHQHQREATHPARALAVLLTWWVPILSLFWLPYSRNHSTTTTMIDTSPTTAKASSPPTTPTVIDRHLLQVLATKEAWFFLWATTIVVGSGTMLTNNMAQMVEARDFPPRAAGACLALFSVAQATARVVTGTASEWALQHCIPRPAFMLLTCALAMAGHITLAVADTRQVFVIGVLLAGAAFGSVWPLMVLIVGDVFGTRHHGANYMFYDGFCSAVGTLLIAKYITASVYEAHIVGGDDDLSCYGDGCFAPTHWMVAALACSGLLSSGLVLYWTRSSYG